ncbi:MAG: acetyltransferase [Alphaproteobacteria bacterium]|nr:acetyltransferase [Alphaproteobacteria bacterium]
MNKLAIIGASGHGKVIADAALLNDSQLEIFFFDDEFPTKKLIANWKVVGTIDDYIRVNEQFSGVIVAIGNNKVRASICEKLLQSKCNLVTVIHKSVIISPFSEIGCGTAVLAGAVINPFCKIGRGSIINTNSNVDHDCNIGDYTHISPGANLAGGVDIGDYVWIGAGATIIQSVQIAKNTIIGASAIVTKSIYESGTYAGNPLRKLNG